MNLTSVALSPLLWTLASAPAPDQPTPTPDTPTDAAVEDPAAPGDAAPADTPDDATAPPTDAPGTVPDPDPAAEADTPPEPAAPDPEPPPEPVAPEATVGVGAAAPSGTAAPPPKVGKAETKVKDDVSPWVPKNEPKRMGEHHVTENIKYRPGTGLEFKSKDGKFAMIPRLRAQIRYSFFNDNAANDQTQSFQLRRARLQFKGHFFGKNNKFKTEIAISPRDVGLTDGNPTRTPLLDWYFDFTQLRDLSIRVGQWKQNYSRQRVISSGDLQLVDRAIANGEFNVDRDIGFSVRSKDFLGLDKLRYYATVSMGEGRDGFSPDTFEMMYIGRIEILPMGMFQDYKEVDFERSFKPRLSLGLAYAYIDGAKRNRGILGSTPTDGGTTDFHNATADAMFKIAGFSLFGEFFYRQGSRKFGTATITDDLGNEVPAPLETARNGVGWFAQAGFLIPKIPFDINARYSQNRRIGNNSSMPDRDEVGGGVGYYFAQHPLKLQLDYFRIWEEAQVADGVDQIRLQLQAAF